MNRFGSVAARRALGEQLRRARKAAGLTQCDVAARTGVGQAQVSTAERGDRSITALELLDMAHLYEVPVGELLEPARDAGAA